MNSDPPVLIALIERLDKQTDSADVICSFNLANRMFVDTRSVMGVEIIDIGSFSLE
ncbi:hypothetical protein [Paenibacillus sp. N3.4]|uniref:hypothetical protein n=1 Tax=Paenibacillus sp. N3.4 TaxID=2603222 RepID=UPI001C9C6452|nr:hypothetical protein [Paenibacillus sp. N3.4]